jgi:hypothetical protein
MLAAKRCRDLSPSMSHRCNQGRRARQGGPFMLDQQYPPTDIFGPLEGKERVMWRGRAGVAEYAFDRAASMPQWTLPESTHVLVTDRRVVYAHASGEHEVTSGELRWLWPQYLRLQPGARSRDRGKAAIRRWSSPGATSRRWTTRTGSRTCCGRRSPGSGWTTPPTSA